MRYTEFIGANDDVIEHRSIKPKNMAKKGDESVWAGDTRAANKLKGMITEDQQLIEEKHHNAEMVPNYANLIFASNNDWIVATDHDDRRFQIIEVSDQKKRDRNYFTALRQQWASGGRECLYWYLTSRQIKQQLEDFNFEMQRVRTHVAMQQMLHSNLEAAWIQEVLDNGGHYRLDQSKPGQWGLKEWSEDKANLIEVNLLYADYLRYAKQRGRSQYQKSKGHLSRAVNQLHQSGYLAGFESSVRQKDRHSDKTLTYWRWASLQELRQQWAEKGYGTGVEEVFWSQPIGSGRLPEGEEEVAVSATDEATVDMEQQAQRQDNRYSKDRFKDLQFD